MVELQYYNIKTPKEILIPKSFNGTVILLNINVEHKDNDELKQLLMNILNAINIKVENSYVINISSELTLAYELFSNKDVKKIIAFGIHPDMISLKTNLIPYRVLNILNKNILFSASLKDLTNNKGLKQKLWKSIKDI